MFLLSAGSTVEADPPLRVRGIVIGFDKGSIRIEDSTGHVIALGTNAQTAYAVVTPTTLDAVQVGDFVGSAVKRRRNHLVAVELALILGAMRAVRIGFYRWDPLPDPAIRDRAAVATTMTNGTIVASKTSQAGLTLSVTLVDASGRPPSWCRRMRLSCATSFNRSVVRIGAFVMIKTNPGARAGLVTIGKGVTPPM